MKLVRLAAGQYQAVSDLEAELAKQESRPREEEPTE